MSCPTPMYRKINGYTVPVPCGRCLRCRIDNRNMWTWRIVAELKHCDGVFVTLTIDDENLRGLSVYKKSLQDYHKRLRKALKGRRIKYFAVSEYGELGFRPHYHEILMNVSLGAPLSREISPDYVAIRRSWPFGFIKVEPASRSNIRYVLKYLDKMQDSRSFALEHPGLNPPFRLISNGIGADWIRSEGFSLLNEQDCFYYDGKFRPLPRYYKEKLGLVDRYREDYSDVSVMSRLSSSPKRLEKVLSNVSHRPGYSFYEDLSVANEKLGSQELLELEKEVEFGKKIFS